MTDEIRYSLFATFYAVILLGCAVSLLVSLMAFFHKEEWKPEEDLAHKALIAFIRKKEKEMGR